MPYIGDVVFTVQVPDRDQDVSYFVFFCKNRKFVSVYAWNRALCDNTNFCCILSPLNLYFLLYNEYCKKTVVLDLSVSLQSCLLNHIILFFAENVEMGCVLQSTCSML